MSWTSHIPFQCKNLNKITEQTSEALEDVAEIENEASYLLDDINDLEEHFPDATIFHRCVNTIEGIISLAGGINPREIEDLVEDVRDAISELRDVPTSLEEQYHDMVSDKDYEIEQAQEKIGDLEDKVSELEEELEELADAKNELSNIVHNEMTWLEGMRPNVA